jgi:predicted ATP-grasp superfamily ATP-dependent carboligase
MRETVGSVTAGGLPDQHGIAALAPEGELMLRALVQDLVAISDVEVVFMRDPRLSFDLPGTAHVARSAWEFWPTFRRAAREVDAVWLIAPEQGGILERLSREVTKAGRVLLGSRPKAVGVTGSKLRTARVLSAAGVVDSTFADEAGIPASVREVVVRPDDGGAAGRRLCSRPRNFASG